MSELSKQQHPAGELVPAEEFPVEEKRGLELIGGHNILELLRHGRVRLSGEDGATVELGELEELDDDAYRVKLEVNFSAAMRERYPGPLPPNPTSIFHESKFIEPGSRNYGNCLFVVDGWGLYGPDGDRIRHESQRFVLRDITKIEFMVPPDVEHPLDRALGASALRSVPEVAG
jgi:hypothetical protein